MAKRQRQQNGKVNTLQVVTIIGLIVVVCFFIYVFFFTGSSEPVIHTPMPERVVADGHLVTATPQVISVVPSDSVQHTYPTPLPTSTPMVLPTAPHGVYVPKDVVCAEYPMIAPGGWLDVFVEVWGMRVVGLVAFGFTIHLSYLIVEMIKSDRTKELRIQAYAERTHHERQIARIEAQQPKQRELVINTPTKSGGSSKNIIPVDKEIAYYFAYNAPSLGLGVRTWLGVDGFDRDSIKVLLEWLVKGYLIDPPRQGKQAEWVDPNNPPSDIQIVLRFGLEEEDYELWVEEYED